MIWRDKNGEPVFRKTKDAVWPLAFHDRPVERKEETVTPFRKVKV